MIIITNKYPGCRHGDEIPHASGAKYIMFQFSFRQLSYPLRQPDIFAGPKGKQKIEDLKSGFVG